MLSASLSYITLALHARIRDADGSADMSHPRQFVQRLFAPYFLLDFTRAVTCFEEKRPTAISEKCAHVYHWKDKIVEWGVLTEYRSRIQWCLWGKKKRKNGIYVNLSRVLIYFCTSWQTEFTLHSLIMPVQPQKTQIYIIIRVFFSDFKDELSLLAHELVVFCSQKPSKTQLVN